MAATTYHHQHHRAARSQWLPSPDTSPALASSTLSSTTADLRLDTTHQLFPASPPIHSLIYYNYTVPVFPSPLTSSSLTASSTLSSSVTALSTYSAPPTSSYHQQQQASSSWFTVPKTNQQISTVIIHLLSVLYIVFRLCLYSSCYE